MLAQLRNRSLAGVTVVAVVTIVAVPSVRGTPRFVRTMRPVLEAIPTPLVRPDESASDLYPPRTTLVRSSVAVAQTIDAEMGLIEASKDNLKRVGSALKWFFEDFARYPQSIDELLIRDGPRGFYLDVLPTDPCTGSPFGIPPAGYTYTPVALPPLDYLLRTHWSATGVGAQCYIANNNANLLFSPYFGLGSVPTGIP